METLVEHIFIIGRGVFVTLHLLVGGLSIGLGLGIPASILRYKKIANKISIEAEKL